MLAHFLWCMLGAVAGISAALWLLALPISPFLLASLGGSAVFLFGLTRAPAVQPRALFAGHLGGALIRITCYRCFGDALWVYALAQVLTLGYMLLIKTAHPPAGANPLIMIYAISSFAVLWQPVFVGVLSLALVAYVWSRLFPGLIHLSRRVVRSLTTFDVVGRLGEVAVRIDGCRLRLSSVDIEKAVCRFPNVCPDAPMLQSVCRRGSLDVAWANLDRVIS